VNGMVEAVNSADEARSGVLERLEKLVSPFGVIADFYPLGSPRGLGDTVAVASAFFGFPVSRADLRYTVDIDQLRESWWGGDFGYGIGLRDIEEARLKALAEAAERYSAGDFNDPVLWSSYRDLKSAALDPRKIPRCSERELTTPGCPLSAFDPDAVIRWTRAINFSRQEQLWIPAIMACYRLHDPHTAESFWYRISTGYAVHSDPAEAVVRGICEVVERDAIAVSWLQQIPLPLVTNQWLSAETRELLAWGRRHFIEYFIFDATTDIGVPTALCLGVAEHAGNFCQALSCATGRTITSAVDKAMLDAVTVRWGDSPTDDLPASAREFHLLSQGVRYMATPDRRAAFGFLINDAQNRLAPERLTLPESSEAMLAWLVGALSEKGMSVLAVDRTTRELAAAGLTAVNVIIPELQPMSLYPAAQYRSHPRLYSAPIQMGYHSHPEEELNPWPIPFG
jgi:ribosomal protein S12 methylthiotransferase accessory factor